MCHKERHDPFSKFHLAELCTTICAEEQGRLNVLITIKRQVIVPFPHTMVDFFSNKVKLLTLFTDLPCSKYFVAEIGQNTISVEKFNLDFTLNSPKLKS